MFGENTIYGSCENNVDNKKRIIIPSFTNVEEGDSLTISREEQNCLIVANAEERNERIKELCNEIVKTHDIKKLKKIQDEIDILCEEVLGCQTVDSQHRIIIPEKAFKYIGIDLPSNKGNIKLYAHGCGNRLKLYRNEDIFEKNKKVKSYL